ncbi:Rieske 2Fe-2S domain-containing protein [Sporichthya sp.]|uniref:Rieske 2Fe-2S domain-containing protein n=1 Tax=Sporichthya sp. TaxID=65475 RepID=UPI0017EFCEC0|nr:Rieske 2Fe-2S domain-containing protein [Sporichthya sp.]MBA3741486.1 Rieske (2Fe-2S) protein [Sporichthya sp.]
MTTVPIEQRADSATPSGQFPYKAFPTGWFQVAWSGELKPGDVRPLHYFAQDLVLYRTAGGEARVVDAHCPHRGAHLGHGGVVQAQTITCPNHGWRWDGAGRSPDAPAGRSDECRLRHWPVREAGELIYLWYDALKGQPTWEPLVVEAYDNPDFYPAYPHGIAIDQVGFPPHLLVENMADMPHVKFVHKWVDFPSLDVWTETGPRLHTVFSGEIPTAKGPTHLVLTNDSWGMGIVFAHFHGLRTTMQVISVIPRDHHNSDLRLSVWVQRPEGARTDEPDNLARAICLAQHREVLEARPGVGSDRPIWENMRYVAQPPLAREEAKVVSQYRRWIKQFYPY